MTTTAVYAGSFDPPTNGHVWMIKKSATLFDWVIVAAADNPEKKYDFPLDERMGWLEGVCAGLENVAVERIENQFLAHFARDRGARFAVRGIRDEDDYQYERGMRYVNSDLNDDLTTVFLMPPRELCQISSSFVKGMVGPKGWEEVVRRYVPADVFASLRAGG